MSIKLVEIPAWSTALSELPNSPICYSASNIIEAKLLRPLLTSTSNCWTFWMDLLTSPATKKSPQLYTCWRSAGSWLRIEWKSNNHWVPANEACGVKNRVPSVHHVIVKWNHHGCNICCNSTDDTWVHWSELSISRRTSFTLQSTTNLPQPIIIIQQKILYRLLIQSWAPFPEWNSFHLG